MSTPVWQWPLALDFWLVGMAAGAYLVAAAANIYGRWRDRPLLRAATGFALGSTATSVAVFIADLGRPERFWRPLTLFSPSTPVNLGGWLLGAFVSLLGPLFLALTFPGLRLSKWWRVLACLPVPVAAAITIYPAAVLYSSHLPLWHLTSLLAPLFVTTALATGAAALLLWVRLFRLAAPRPPAAAPGTPVAALLRALLLPLGANLALLVAFTLQFAYRDEVHFQQAWRDLHSGWQRWAHWGGALGLGVAALGLGAAALWLSPFWRGRHLLPCLAAALVLLSGLAQRLVIVYGGRR